MDREAYLNSLAKKRMGSGAFLFNSQHELLLVKPNYKEGWILPGDSVEENESPYVACIREVEEEVGLKLQKFRLICVDYVKNSEGENLQFIFDGGVLEQDVISQIKVQESELLDFKFVKESELVKYLNSNLTSRVMESLKAVQKNISIYLENGQYV